jgi:S1-C subfamily serine protease
MQDLMQSMMQTMMSSSKPQPKIAASAGQWGLEASKSVADESDGVNVAEVLKGGAAAEAGIKAGDRILTVDGRWTDSVSDLHAAAGFVKAGQDAVVVLKRDAKQIRLVIRPRVGF